MSALLPDERFDGSAIDAIEEAKPTPPPAPRQSVMVLVVDESGPELRAVSDSDEHARHLDAVCDALAVVQTRPSSPIRIRGVM